MFFLKYEVITSNSRRGGTKRTDGYEAERWYKIWSFTSEINEEISRQMMLETGL
ncbi:hypothetical protein [Halobacillus campisalis]|uniref:hypothetical protein n=1 Tax=Halobacillus campisalis TaxID=435909 RepID=UPI0036F3CFCD